MENASKALIMAGTILIGVLLLTLLVYFFTSASRVNKIYTEDSATTKINQFNTKFTKYNITREQYINSNKKLYVTIYDIITLGNMAAEYNKGFSKSDEEYIWIGISNIDSDISDNTIQYNNELLKDYNDIPNNKLVVKELIYGESGRVKQMVFMFAETGR